MGVELMVIEISVKAVKRCLVDCSIEFRLGRGGLETEIRTSTIGRVSTRLLHTAFAPLRGIRFPMGPGRVILAARGTSLMEEPLTVGGILVLARRGLGLTTSGSLENTSLMRRSIPLLESREGRVFTL
jgi:hypothetical protein